MTKSPDNREARRHLMRSDAKLGAIIKCVGPCRLDLHGLKRHDDDEVMRQLVAVKGIGRWTAEIFLMFRLGRPGVLPADDLGLMNAVRRAYGLRTRPTPEKLRKIGGERLTTKNTKSTKGLDQNASCPFVAFVCLRGCLSISTSP